MPQTNAVRWGYLSRLMIIFLILLYWILFGATQAGQVSLPVLTINCVFVAIVLIYFIFRGLKTFSFADMLILILLVYLLVNSFLSIDPYRSLNEWILYALIFLAFTLTSRLVSKLIPAELVIKSILMCGLIVMIYGWINVGSFYSNWWIQNPNSLVPSVSYRLPVPNLMAVLMNMFFLLALNRVFYSEKILNKIVLIMYGLSALGLLYFSSSRGGIGGAGIGVLLVLFFQRKMIFGWINTAWKYVKPRKLLLAVLIIVILLAAVVAGYLVYKMMLHPSHYSIWTARQEFWPPAIDSFLRSPIIGEGLFTFRDAYLHVNLVPPKILFYYAHSIYFDILSSTGIIGVLLFAGVFFYILKRINLTRKIKSYPIRAVSEGALSIAGAFFAHGIFDSVHFTEPSSGFIFAVILGAAFAPVLGQPQESTKVVSKMHLPLIWVISCLALMAVNIWMFVPLQNGVRAVNENGMQAGEDYFEEAVDRAPGSIPAVEQLGIVYGFLAVDDSEYLGKAIEQFESLVELDPLWSTNWLNLAALYRENGDMEKAAEMIERAYQLAPRSEIVMLNYALIMEENNDLEAASSVYKTLLNRKPEYQNAFLWSGSPFRQHLLSEWQSEYESTAKSLEDLRTALQNNPDNLGAYYNLASYYLQEGLVEDADEVLKQSDFVYRLDTYDHLKITLLKYQTATLLERTDEAESLQGYLSLAFEEQGIYGPGSYGMHEYTPHAFRRPTIAQDMVPMVATVQLDWESLIP